MANSEQYKYIQNRIKENPVMIFSKTTCGYCGMVKELLGNIGCDYTLEEIDGKKDCEQLQDIFEKITGSRTVCLIIFHLSRVTINKWFKGTSACIYIQK